MALIAAKCTECGAAIEVDDTKDAGICRHCGTAFVTQKVIHNHSTHVTQHITKNFYGQEKASAEGYLENGETFLKLKDWVKAIGAFTQAADTNPNDYRGWFGLVRGETKNLTDVTDERHIAHLNKAVAVASDTEKEIMKGIYATYQKCRKEYQAKKKQNDDKVIALNAEINQMKLPDVFKLNILIAVLFAGGIVISIASLWLADVFGLVFLFAGFFPGLVIIAAGIVIQIIGQKLEKKAKGKAEPQKHQIWEIEQQTKELAKSLSTQLSKP